MPRKRKRWTKVVGAVTIYEREPGGILYLRWWDANARGARAGGGDGNYRVRSLRHRDQALAERQASVIAADLLLADEAARHGRVLLRPLLARYELEVSAHKKGAQPAEDRRRMDLWAAVLGGEADVTQLTHGALDAFARDRRAGAIRVPGRKLKQRPSERTVGADIVFLQAVLNWAVQERILRENPLRGYDVPETARPRRPVATWERFLRVYRYADRVDAQRLFRCLWILELELGWRVSALCRLRAGDVDRRYAEHDAPYGRIRKRAETDKERVEQWVPLSPRARRAVDLLLRRRPVVGEAYLFPAPRKAGRPWSRWHARDLLERAEAAAELRPQEGGQWHPYRRMWATVRKHLPAKDVAYVGGWKDLRSLENCYQQPDAETVLAVVQVDRKLVAKGGSAMKSAMTGAGPDAERPDRVTAGRAAG